MAEDGTTDPFDWDNDRVIQELCSENKSWDSSLINPKNFPDKQYLEAKLREHEVDGESLLIFSEEDPVSFWADLGIKVMRHKQTLRTVLKQLRAHSAKYSRSKQQGDRMDFKDEQTSNWGFDHGNRKAKLEIERQSRDESARLPFLGHNHLYEEFDEESRKRKLEQERASRDEDVPPMDLAGGLPVASTALTASNREYGQVITPPVAAEEPMRKKRRIVPKTLTTDVDLNVIHNIPTEVDAIMERLGIAAPSLVDHVHIRPSETYIGNGSLNRVDIIDIDPQVSSATLSHEDKTFQFHQTACPLGRQRQVHHIVRHQLLRRRDSTRIRTMRTDMVPGANDPDHDDVLPMYGESDEDDEYDSDTWAEIEAEQQERESRRADATFLNPEEINAVIDESIQEFVDSWNGKKLLVLQRNANSLWRKTRGYSLKPALDAEQRDLDRYEQRLKKYREDFVGQKWSKKEDLKEVLRALEVTIFDRQRALWMIGLLRLPQEPTKPPTKPPKQPKVPRQIVHPVRKQLAADEESLGSDSDDEMRDFIDDEDDAEVEVEEDTQGDTQADVDMLDVRHNDATNDLIGPGISDSLAVGSSVSDSEVSKPIANDPTNGDVLITGMDDGEVAEEQEVLDLTQVDCSTPKKPKYPSTRRHPKAGALGDRSNPVDLVRPEKTTPNHKDVHSTPSTLRMPIFMKGGLDDLPAEILDEMTLGEKAVYDELRKHDEQDVRFIFGLVFEWSDDLLYNYILLALDTDLPTGPSFRSAKDKDLWLRSLFLRLLLMFTDDTHYSISDYKALIAESGELIREKPFKVPEFNDFIRKLAQYCQKKPDRKLFTTPASSARSKNDKLPYSHNTIEADGDDEDEDGDDHDEQSPTPTSTKKKIIHRDKAAQNLRESDRRRVHEQEERRRMLRQRLAADGTAASQKANLIINETKLDHQGFVHVHDNIAGRIKDHQVEGVRFMWNQIVTDAQTRQGCLLAHTMGLGKTMQIITLLVAIAGAAASEDPSISSQISDDLKESKTLVLAPAGLVNNWQDEFLLWAPEGHHLGQLYKIDSTVDDQDRKNMITDWASYGGVLIVGYPIFKLLLKIENLTEKLTDSPNVIVADEAHMMKNPKSETHIATSSFRSHIRIALTGSPLANNVEEYHSMINWVAPNYLSDLREFRQVYAIPIEAGLSVESTAGERRKALTKLRALKETVSPKVHRKSIAVLKDSIPPKMEFVLSMPLTQVQRQAYETYMKHYGGADSTAKGFAALNNLALLCNHPAVFNARLMEAKNDPVGKISKRSEDLTGDAALPPQLVSELLTLLQKKAPAIENVDYSWKVPLLLKILDESKRLNDGVLIFSQSIPTLQYLETILRRQRRSVTSLDGKTSMDQRQLMVKDFNQRKYEIFLISTTAGGLGLNITGANRVVIFDFKFNPQHEQQAVGRAYRLGQTKPVFVYRFLCGGTFEEKLQNKAIFKLQLSSRVVDKKNPVPKAQRFEELFAPPTDPRQENLSQHLGKDVVLDSILQSNAHKVGIRSIVMTDTFEEESFEDQNLTQEEKREADMLINQHRSRLTGLPQLSSPLGAHPAVPTTAPLVLPTPSLAAPTHPVIAPIHYSMAPSTASQVPAAVPETPAAVQSPRVSPPAVASTPRRQNAIGTMHAVNGMASWSEPVVMSSTPPATMVSPNSATHITQDGPTPPVLGSSTRIRQPPTLNPLPFQHFKGELVRLFGSGVLATVVKDKRKRTAEAIATSFERKPDSSSLLAAKWAIMEEAKSPRFIEAVVTGVVTPDRLASLTAEDIRAQAQGWQSLSEHKWNDSIVMKQYSTGDPESRRSSPHAALTPNRSDGQAGQRRAHNSDDRAALEEYRARKAPRLPEWAKDAVNNRGRPSSSSSPGPPKPTSNPKFTPRNPFGEG